MIDFNKKEENTLRKKEEESVFLTVELREMF